MISAATEVSTLGSRAMAKLASAKNKLPQPQRQPFTDYMKSRFVAHISGVLLSMQ